MNIYQLNGLTPEQLHALIMESPAGFSAQANSIQYLGKQIQLHNGSIRLSDQTFITATSLQLFKRLINLQPDLEAKLPSSKAKAIEIAARNLVKKFHLGAIEKSPTKEVLCAVFLECMRLRTVLVIKKLSDNNSLSPAEKLRIMLDAEEKKICTHSALSWYLVEIPLPIRFVEAKNLFQRLPDTPFLAEEAIEINEYLTTIQGGGDNPIKDRLLEIRLIFKLEDNELANQLLSEVSHIKKIFAPKIEENGHLSKIKDLSDFNTYTRRLLYLYAACSGFSQKADIAELTSYIRSVLYCTTNSDCIWHIAKELAYLSKQPGSIDYCRYIDALAYLLKKPSQLALKFKEYEQLSDLKGFALLESHKSLAPYLAALRANIDSMIPDYSQVLLPEVDNLEREFAEKVLPEAKPAIKAKMHRLLMVIAACKSSRQIIDTSVLAVFVRTIMMHASKKNIPYLISGLARLVQSTPKIQQVLGGLGIKIGEHLQLAPLPLLAFVPSIISEDDVEALCKSLRACGPGKRQMKDKKVFHQWLATIEQASASAVTNRAMIIPILTTLIQSLTFEKLGLLGMTFKLGVGFNGFLESMGLSCQEEGLPLLIAEKGGDALESKSKEVSEWLFKQRHYHLLPYYMASMTNYCDSSGDTGLIPLIHEFIQASANNTFIENRQSPLHNLHLQTVYQKYPKFIAGWRANFSNFSKETRNKLLSPRETLELTENPWDLFISGLEVSTCQSPNGTPHCNSGLMGYVMDGRSAMIARKNKKGTILSRSLIRMVLDKSNHPALFLERAYPGKDDLLFIDAARDIAEEMNLPLYHRTDSEQGDVVTLLEGRAPFDYFDSLTETKLKSRQKVTITHVKRDVSHR